MVLSLNPPRELRWWLSAGGLKNVRLEPVAGAGSAADVSAVRSGFLSGSRLAAGWAVRRGDRSGLVRPVRGWPAGGFEQVHPLVLAVPVFGEMHGEVAAAVAGGAGGDADEVGAQGGAASFGVCEAGRAAGGA